jgi:hypothetical protein
VSKNLPSVTSVIPRDLRNFLDRLRELVNGGGSGRLVTAQDLADAGVVTIDSGGGLTAAAVTTDFGTPPAPTSVTATPAIRNVIVEWDDPAYPTHAYAEVWGASTNSISAAVLLGQTPGSIYADELGPSATRYYWVRFVNTQFTTGPYNATNGTVATTGADLAYTMGLLRDTYGGTSEAPFFQLNTSTVINGVTIPAGTYMKAAFIYDAEITNAKIANLAVDTAKLADASVTTAKIVDANITTAKIANANITTAKIADANITTAKIADANITTAKIASAAISLAKIDTATITNLSALSANMGTITAGDVSIGSSPAINGTSMTGTGSRIYSDGRMVVGNSTNNMVFDGTTLSINGDVVGYGNLNGTTIGQIIAGSFNFVAFLSTGSSTFTVPSFVYKIKVTVVGGGGGAASITYPGGGGSGGSAIGVFEVTPGASYTVVVGAGGARGAAGGASSFSGTGISITCNGGSTDTTRQGGAGGTASGGQINIRGGYGGGTSTFSYSLIPGLGGNTIFGGGGGNGNNGSANTGGGGGGIASNSGGGAGGSGVVIVEY